MERSDCEPELRAQRQAWDPVEGMAFVQEWRGKRLGWQRLRKEEKMFGLVDMPGNYDKSRLLDTAKETVSGRGKNYGTPEDNFTRIACHWETFILNAKGTAIDLTPGDVAIMMALMKIARLENDPKHADSWIDLAGYAACGAEIETA